MRLQGSSGPALRAPEAFGDSPWLQGVGLRVLVLRVEGLRLRVEDPMGLSWLLGFRV